MDNQKVGRPEAGVRNVLNERGTRYGNFTDNATIAQNLKDIWRDSPGCNLNIGCVQTMLTIREGMEMILHKVARICNGDPTYLDSWVDIMGYAQLVIDALQSQEQGCPTRLTPKEALRETLTEKKVSMSTSEKLQTEDLQQWSQSNTSRSSHLTKLQSEF